MSKPCLLRPRRPLLIHRQWQLPRRCTSEQLLQDLTPLWQEAGWTLPDDSSWGLKLCDLLGPSLTLLKDGVEQATPFFVRPELEQDGRQQLEVDGARAAITALADALDADPWDGNDSDRAQELLGNAAKAAGVKKGVIMKSLRAALLGRLQGPDLITAWALLARIGEDRPRLRRCLA